MNVILHEYAQGGRHAVELSNDGREFLGDLDGQRKPGERICAFLEAACDDTEKGYDRLLESLAWLTAEIQKRKAAPPVSAAG